MCAHEKMLKTLKGCNVYAKPEVALLRSHGKLPANRRRSLSINRGRISEERVIATMAASSKQSQKESFVRMDDDVNRHYRPSHSYPPLLLTMMVATSKSSNCYKYSSFPEISICTVHTEIQRGRVLRSIHSRAWL